MSIEAVRLEIYRSFIDAGRAPSALEVSAATGLGEGEVDASLGRLDDEDVIALFPGTSTIWLAHPFCAVEAPFEVRSGERSWSAICIWDALGILAMLELDGAVDTRCPDCELEMRVDVTGGDVVAPDDSLIHFGVPAARWYEDIAFT